MTTAPDIAIGDTFAQPWRPDEAWEVTQTMDLAASRCGRPALITLMRGESMRFATEKQLLDTAQWVRVRVV